MKNKMTAFYEPRICFNKNYRNPLENLKIEMLFDTKLKNIETIQPMLKTVYKLCLLKSVVLYCHANPLQILCEADRPKLQAKLFPIISNIVRSHIQDWQML